MRLLDIKAPSGIKKGDLCKYAVCLHLACKYCGEQFERDAAIKACGADSNIYTQAFSVVSNLLGVKLESSFTELGVKFGCEHIAAPASRILKRYQKLFLERLPPERRQYMDFSRPVFTAVAFFLTAQYYRTKIDKGKLKEVIEIDSQEFRNIYGSMDELIFAPIRVKQEKETQDKLEKNPDAQKKKPRVRAKKKTSLPSEEAPVDENQSGEDQGPNENTTKQVKKKKPEVPKVSALNSNVFIEKKEVDVEETLNLLNNDTSSLAADPSVAKREEKNKKRKREDFEEWKERMLNMPKVEVPRKAKQQKLDFTPTKSQK